MYLNNKNGENTKYWRVCAVSDLLSLAGGLRAGQVGEHVLDLRHVGHDVLHQHQGGRVEQLTFPFLPQYILVTAEIKRKYEIT